MNKYVHGYSQKESRRLKDQANTLAEMLHWDTTYPEGSKILEAGCGTGAQTIHLAKNSPGASFTSIDISPDSLNKAENKIKNENISNVSIKQADIFNLPFEKESFDHIFVCFVLEHLSHPVKALEHLKKYLKKEGSITVIEGDHDSFYCHPKSENANHAVQCLIDIQEKLGGNSLIGRELYPLIKKSDFKNIHVSPQMVYVDSSMPELVEGFSKNTFIAMVESVRDQAISMNLIDEVTWDKGIKDLYRATKDDGTFCYTFFKGTAFK